MDYKRHYTRLIERARNRIIDGYVERHHVIPRCMSGSDYEGNLVSLTPEEHLIAHLLLVKMFPGNQKLLYAANMMVNCENGIYNNNKRYGWVRRMHAASMVGTNNPFYGKHHSEETLKKMRGPRGRMSDQFREYCKTRVGSKNPFYGKHVTEANKRKLAEARHNHTGWHHTDETRLKMSMSAKGRISPLRGRPQSEESKRKKSVAATLRWARERESRKSNAATN